MNSSRRRAACSVPGSRTVCRRGDGAAPDLDLAYVRERPGNGPVALVVPGGPGVAVPLMYRAFRRRAADAGLDVIMVEHRGVGLSRADVTGHDLSPEALSIPQVVADLEAVLDVEGIERAIVSGTSYGSYVAAAFAVTHPHRLDGLVLDSVMFSAQDHHDVRAHARSLLWDGASAHTAGSVWRLRALVEHLGLEPLALGQVARTLYEFGGAPLLDTYLDQLAEDRARIQAVTAPAMVISGDRELRTWSLRRRSRGRDEACR